MFMKLFVDLETQVNELIKQVEYVNQYNKALGENYLRCKEHVREIDKQR